MPFRVGEVPIIHSAVLPKASSLIQFFERLQRGESEDFKCPLKRVKSSIGISATSLKQTGIYGQLQSKFDDRVVVTLVGSTIKQQ